jgi:hypothetical protein
MSLSPVDPQLFFPNQTLISVESAELFSSTKRYEAVLRSRAQLIEEAGSDGSGSELLRELGVVPSKGGTIPKNNPVVPGQQPTNPRPITRSLANRLHLAKISDREIGPSSTHPGGREVSQSLFATLPDMRTKSSSLTLLVVRVPHTV